VLKNILLYPAGFFFPRTARRSDVALSEPLGWHAAHVLFFFFVIVSETHRMSGSQGVWCHRTELSRKQNYPTRHAMRGEACEACGCGSAASWAWAWAWAWSCMWRRRANCDRSPSSCAFLESKETHPNHGGVAGSLAANSQGSRRRKGQTTQHCHGC
jgi:hypothetical protein